MDSADMLRLAVFAATAGALLCVAVLVADIRRFARSSRLGDGWVSKSLRGLVDQFDNDLQGARELLLTDREHARDHLDKLRSSIRTQLARQEQVGLRTYEDLERRKLAADVLYSEVIFNDGHPLRAVEIAQRTVHGIRTLRATSSAEEEQWDALEMDALYTLACAQQLSGEYLASLRTAARAVGIAERLPKALSTRVISTYANILLVKDTDASGRLLRELLADRVETGGERDALLVEVHLSMALVLQAWAQSSAEARQPSLGSLGEAWNRLIDAFEGCRSQGLDADAAASALMLGIVAALTKDDGSDIAWFSQAVDLSSRGHHAETLWRSQINLASAMYSRGREVTDEIHAHARAALKIMDASLPLVQRDRSPRFEFILVPLVKVVRLLREVGDETAMSTIEKYPRLRAFLEVKDRSPEIAAHDSQNQWLPVVGSENFVLY